MTGGRYDSWSEEQCAGIEIVDGAITRRPGASERHNRLARMPAYGLVDCAVTNGRGTGLRSTPPVVVLTSDRDDWSKLCGDRVVIRDV